MKIGIEAQRIFRPKKHGMDVVAIELIKNLQLIDQQNSYTVFGREGVNDVIPPAPNFKVETFSSFTYADWEQYHLVRKAKEHRLDLLHCTANTAPMSGKTPLIITVHDIIYLESVDFKGTAYQNLGNLYRRFIVPKVASKAELILTVSEFERDNILRRLKLPEQKVQVLYNGVGPQFNNRYPQEEVAAFRRQYNLPEQFIMFLGNTAPKKNTPNVIRAFVKFCLETGNKTPLVLLDYKKELVEKLLEEMKQTSLLSLFVFPGYVPYKSIPLMYNAATLFLYPSLRESFGLPILEAMACGVPVITSTTSSMPEVAGDAALLADPFKVEELAAGMHQMMSSEATRQQYREAGLQRCKQFTWEASAKQLLRIYESFVK